MTLGTRAGASDREGSLDDNLDISDSMWQASVFCPCIQVDAPGSDAERLEDENMASE